ncbi:MAG: O-acetylhomoserine aminocarboxypropyltransferase [Spirochaetae bacterium HGW-Spirochaetae-7]|jgi:O-acetylhomoserine (thiol)-lyase|nr:MAG: O-acetylhomoserine aminocarboxypropyltransferase [Spirochaetae bacterium HGW-Spirochaetae-7]
MAQDTNPRFETISVQAGHSPDPTTLSRGVPVYRTSSFTFKSAEHAANLFALKEFGNIYSRLGNPTNDVLEARVTALEGGAASVSVASGAAAIFNTVITIAKAGDEIVSASNLYGGTYTLFDAILPDLGITTKFVDVLDPSAFEKAISPKTRLIYIETIGNPVLDLADVEAISKIARKHKLPLVVDATFTTPYLLQTIALGADIVINSLTKWLGGHGTAIGGIVTDAGTFDWSDPKFELFNKPDKNYHGLRWAMDLPPELRKIAFALRFRTVPLRNIGACLSPDNAWMFLQGIETLHVRMPRHAENALAVATFLKKHPKVAWVRYPGLEGDLSYALSKKILRKGAGGMVVFGVKGGKPAGERFIESLKLFSHLANVGDAKSLALHPASTSHSQLTEEQQKASGLTADLVRLSIGIENIDDIIADLERGLGAV